MYYTILLTIEISNLEQVNNSLNLFPIVQKNVRQFIRISNVWTSKTIVL